MSQVAQESPQYYLGIDGDQTGPYSEADIIEKIQSQTIPDDALVWHEGLSAWTAIHSIPAFASALGGAGGSAAPPPPSIAQVAAQPPAATPSMPGGVSALSTPEDEGYESHQPEAPASDRSGRPVRATGPSGLDVSSTSTFVAPGQKVETVFKGKEAVFSRPAFMTTRLGLTLLFVAFCASLGFGIFYWQVKFSSVEQSIVKSTKQGLRVRLTRAQQVRQALSELIIKPSDTLPRLEKIVEEDSSDAAGTEALEAAIDYYRRNRRYVDAGNLLMKAKKPLKAADFYLYDPPNYQRAETALFTAYETSKDNDARFDSLVRNINLLLGPLNGAESREKAGGRIQLLAREFPNRAHPFGYYLKSTEEKLKIMFDRLSFHFSEGITNLLDADFPDITLAGTPEVKLEKNKQGKYRVVATYSGDVLLGRDRLKNITLTFWAVTDRWYLVDTNLTSERRRWALSQKRKILNDVITPGAMLDFLESIHLNRFPKISLHESLTKQ
ncbi:MAG: DUF4339 domain-containing protein [Bdellovibrionales bacterium]|nr:DUF4339 domain-containing protein [Bdellovibrionales bacterium]